MGFRTIVCSRLSVFAASKRMSKENQVGTREGGVTREPVHVILSLTCQF